MKVSIKHKALLLALAGAIIGFSAPVLAAEGLNRASVQDDAVFDTTAQLNEGRSAYQRGDYEKAFQVFRNIVVFGQPEVHYYLGLMYAEGLGTRKSQNLAAHWLGLAAKHRYPGAAEALNALKPAGATG